MSSRIVTRAAALGVVGALALTACSSSGGRKAEERKAAEAGAPITMTVALVTHSAPGDTFWDLVRKGAEDAGRKDGIKVEYSADPDGAKQASLVQAAVDKKVDGIAVTLGKPDQMKGAVGNATKAGIPVTGLNSGSDVYKEFGLLGFFGQPEKTAGEAVGDRLKAAGAKKPICVIHEQGNVGLEDRCAGLKAKVPATQLLYVNGKNPADVISGVTSKLQQDKAIDWVITLNADRALESVRAKGTAGSKAKVGTFDMNADLVKAIKDGKVEFAIDQQPWLQGYLAIDAIWQYKKTGVVMGGGQPTLTGPAFVDKKNADDVEKYAKEGTR